MSFEKILLFFKPGLDIKEILTVAEKISKFGKKIYILKEPQSEEVLKTAEKNNIKINVIESEKLKEEGVELITVLGGDGAILRAFHKIIESKINIPVFGINRGRVGFLSFGTEEKLDDVLQKVFEGRFRVEKRKTLEGEILGRKIYAVNDFVIKSSDGLADFEIRTEKEYIGSVRADGLIISSQIGSTAYNISVGGPIVYPDLEVIIISFIAPFSLSARSIILSEKNKIFVEVKTSFVVFADGKKIQVPQTKEEKKTLSFQLSDFQIKLVKAEKSSFFQSLRTKLKWLEQ
jgi:NAD+ kinase